MSRPHDGQRALFPFGNPLRGIFHRGSNLSPKLRLLLNSFEQNLADKLRKLRPEDLSEVFSLCWMAKSILALQEIHKDVKDLINELEFPVSDWDEKWIDIYFDSSVKLLDICIALSSELSQLNQGQFLLKYVLHILENPSSSPMSDRLMKAHVSLHDWRRQINLKNPKLENCLALLQSFHGNIYLPNIKNSAKGKVLMRALYGVKVTTAFLCSITVSSLSGSCTTFEDLHVHEKFLWFEAFSSFQSVVNEEMGRHFSSRKHTMLKELEAVQVCVSRLQALTNSKCEDCCKEEPLQQGNDGGNHDEDVMAPGKSTNFEDKLWLKECITSLADGAVKFGQELDFLSKQVDDFFHIVLTGRDELLSNLRLPQVTEVILREKGHGMSDANRK